jgi:hypothetical protein
VLAALQSSQPQQTEVLLTALLNEITSLQDRLILVLDDYHLFNSQPVDQALAFLIEHMPPQLHLLIATREDPQLPLARLRARGHMTKLRAANLRCFRGQRWIPAFNLPLPLVSCSGAFSRQRAQAWQRRDHRVSRIASSAKSR